jgi:hypothetical protein
MEMKSVRDRVWGRSEQAKHWDLLKRNQVLMSQQISELDEQDKMLR